MLDNTYSTHLQVRSKTSSGMARKPPGRAVCRDAVGTGKNGGYVSESVRGASHPIASDRATLEP